LGAIGLAFGGKTFGPAVTGAAPGSRWVKKNGLFRTAGPAKVGLVKGNDRREITYQAIRKIEDDVLASIGRSRSSSGNPPSPGKARSTGSRTTATCLSRKSTMSS